MSLAAARRRLRENERAAFFGHWLRRPLGIGAALPSGAASARALAREVALERPGIVLELGGGTGSVTRAILDAGCPHYRLVAVEREPALARILRRNFPLISVVEADACGMDDLLSSLRVTHLATVVSSLPIKWFGRAAQRAVLEPCLDRLGPAGPFLQMTNALASPLPMRSLGLAGIEVARIWSEFPPVQVWRYWRPEMPSRARPRDEDA